MSGFSNPLVGGGGALVYPSVHSPNFITGISGWTINKDGSSEFQNVTIRGTFSGTDLILNSTGMFFYSSAPASGNLIASVVPGISTVTDPEGNTAQPGISAYGGSGNTLISQLFSGALNLGLAAQLDFASGAAPGGVSSIVFGSGWGVSLNSGQTSALDVVAFCQLVSSLASGVTNGTAQLSAGQVTLGAVNSAVVVDDNNNRVGIATGGVTNISNNALGLPAGGGPFIPNEAFHNISLAAGTTGLLSGGVAMKVKKLPWNAIWMDIEFSYTSAGNTTFTFGSLPDSTYYPAETRHFPLVTTGSPAAAPVQIDARVFMPTSGAVQVVVPAMSASSTYTIGGAIMYPTND